MNLSKFLSINVQDIMKAVIVAILTPCAAYLGQVLTAFSTSGTFAIDWPTLGHYALAGFVGYLVKQFLTNSNGVPLAGEPKA